MPEATHNELLRENLAAALRENSRNLPETTITAIINFVVDPTKPITVRGIQRIAQVSKPTARRYRNLLLASMENPPEALARAANAETLVSEETLARVREETHPLRDEGLNLTRRPIQPDSASRIDGQEVARIIDRQIRRLDHQDAPAANQIKGLLDLKIRYEELEHGNAENKQDPHKLLGPRGLPALTETVQERFDQIIAHRREMAPLISHIITSLYQALHTETSLSYLSDEAREILSSPFWTPADAPKGEGDETSVSKDAAEIAQIADPSSPPEPDASPPGEEDHK